MFINHSAREVTAKIVYYGPGLSGKTTNLQYIFSVTNPKTRGELISIETEVERTLFFDLLPINVGLIGGYQTKFQLYTVPGQVFYDSTRKMVLRGADGIVFVADSQDLMRQANLESLENLEENLAANKLNINEIPMVFQYNKRDLSNTLSINQLNGFINKWDRPYHSAVATEGKGVLETLRGISTLILKEIKLTVEQAAAESGDVPILRVDFDTNKKQKIIEKENLPLKKIYTENLESVSYQMEPSEHEIELTPADEKQEGKEPDELEVETLGETEQYKDMDNIFLGETVEDIDDLEEIKLGEEDEVLELTASELKDTADFDEAKIDTRPLGVPEEEELDEDTNPFKDIKGMGDQLADQGLKEVQELEDIEEIKVDEEEHEPVPVSREFGTFESVEPAEPAESAESLEPFEVDYEVIPGMELVQIGEIEQIEQIEQTEQVGQKEQTEQLIEPEAVKREIARAPKKIEAELKPGKPTREITEIEEIKKSLEAKTPPPKVKTPPAKISELDLLERLKDKSRLTVIKEVRVTDAQLIIDIKDKNAKVLESIKVDIKPEIKKVNLIIDVKK
jgi:signal recognition particle receptor subunit beta